jgi:stage II sporulation protein D
VVARTYALYRRAHRSSAGYDLESSTDGQVYGGVAAETRTTGAAVAATRGEILTHAGAPILAVYHSSSGGRTASAEEVWGRPVPYLVSVPVEDEEDSPHAYWRAPIARSTLGPALAPLGVRVGAIRSLQVGERTESGRAAWVVVEGADGSERIDAGALRRALGADVIRSTLFEIRSGSAGVVVVGSGHGHGVGMSQWGAEAMARRGRGYREILAAFYPGARLGRAGEVAAR